MLSISTPSQQAIALAEARWSVFTEPRAADVGGVFIVWLTATSATSANADDALGVAVEWTQDGEKWLLPGARESIGGESLGSKDGQCCIITAMFKFDVGSEDRLAGVGYIVIRWAGAERRIPLDFDYLW